MLGQPDWQGGSSLDRCGPAGPGQRSGRGAPCDHARLTDATAGSDGSTSAAPGSLAAGRPRLEARSRFRPDCRPGSGPTFRADSPGPPPSRCSTYQAPPDPRCRDPPYRSLRPSPGAGHPGSSTTEPKPALRPRPTEGISPLTLGLQIGPQPRAHSRDRPPHRHSRFHERSGPHTAPGARVRPAGVPAPGQRREVSECSVPRSAARCEPGPLPGSGIRRGRCSRCRSSRWRRL